MTRLALLLALGGCDYLFNLDRLPGRDAAGGDSSDDADTTSDSGSCTIGHDEDTDSELDPCDRCPTYPPKAGNLGDNDGDGLPNECDGDNGDMGKDTILAYWPFATSDLTSFTETGLVTPMPLLNNGRVRIGASSSLTTTASFALTRVDFHISNAMTTNLSSELQIRVGGTPICLIKGASCNGTVTTQTCLQYASANPVDFAHPTAQLVRLTLMRVGGNNVQCEIATNGTTTMVGAAATMPSGTIGIATTVTSSFNLEAIVVYGTP